MKSVINWLSVVLFFGCVTLGYVAAHQKIEIVRTTKLITSAQGELARAKSEAKQADSRREAAEKEAQQQILILQRQLTTAKEAETQAEKQASAAEAERASSSSAESGGADKSGSNVVHLSDIMKDHPEYAALYAKQIRRQIDRMYGDTLNTLNLPPQQLSQLKDLLVERQMSFMDAMRLTGAAGLKQGSPEWQEAIKQASQDVDQQISAILGDSGNSKLMQMQARAGIQSQITYTYAPDFADANIPLSAEQSRNLAQVMADANYAGRTPPKGYNNVDPTTGLSPHDVQILTAAAGVLSPAQIEILRTDQIQSHQSAAILRQYYSKNGGPVSFVP